MFICFCSRLGRRNVSSKQLFFEILYVSAPASGGETFRDHISGGGGVRTSGKCFCKVTAQTRRGHSRNIRETSAKHCLSKKCREWAIAHSGLHSLAWNRFETYIKYICLYVIWPVHRQPTEAAQGHLKRARLNSTPGTSQSLILHSFLLLRSGLRTSGLD